jgi:hypothetical protein
MQYVRSVAALAVVAVTLAVSFAPHPSLALGIDNPRDNCNNTEVGNDTSTCETENVRGIW